MATVARVHANQANLTNARRIPTRCVRKVPLSSEGRIAWGSLSVDRRVIRVDAGNKGQDGNLTRRSFLDDLERFVRDRERTRLTVARLDVPVSWDAFGIPRNAAKVHAVSAEPKPTEMSSKNEYAIRTLTTWLLNEERKGTIDNELVVVFTSIATACKQIASLVNRAGISNLTGLAGETNVQGEDQKKLDVVSNDVFCNCLRASGRTGIIASEEEDTPVAVEDTYSGNYIVVFDPLDGSSNIDAGISTGSIFGIYEPTAECRMDVTDADELVQNCIVNVCQPGNGLLGAGYCMYSSSTVLVLSIGSGVYGFTLDPQIGEFVLTHDNVKIPEEGKIYSFNEGNYASWEKGLQNYMSELKDPADGSKPYSARYIGSLVGDFHRTLLYGGIYGYPGDKKNPNGKLRLLYECAPMSFIAEQAGGKGSTGHGSVLEVCPDQVHQRVPLFVGSKKEVEKLESFL